MEIPKRINYLIDQREKLAKKLNHTDCELSEWMEKQGMNLFEMSDFTRNGCMIYCEPNAAARSVKEEIEKYEK